MNKHTPIANLKHLLQAACKSRRVYVWPARHTRTRGGQLSNDELKIVMNCTSKDCGGIPAVQIYFDGMRVAFTDNDAPEVSLPKKNKCNCFVNTKTNNQQQCLPKFKRSATTAAIKCLASALLPLKLQNNTVRFTGSTFASSCACDKNTVQTHTCTHANTKNN